MTGPVHPRVAEVARLLADSGSPGEVRVLPDEVRTAAAAAAALGVPVGAIVKSLCFVADGAPVMVLVSGANRGDPGKIRSVLGAATVSRPDADTVRAATGFAIGGVPPVAHATPLRLVLDRDLLRYDELWAAAGTPHSVFRVTPAQLVALTGGAVADVAEEPRP